MPVTTRAMTQRLAAMDTCPPGMADRAALSREDKTQGRGLPGARRLHACSYVCGKVFGSHYALARHRSQMHSQKGLFFRILDEIPFGTCTKKEALTKYYKEILMVCKMAADLEQPESGPSRAAGDTRGQ